MFPPIRRVAEGMFLLMPGPDCDAIVAAGQKALSGSSLGEATNRRTADGKWHRGFHVREVPEDLAVLGIRPGTLLTAVNGMPISDGASLLRAIAAQFQVRDRSTDKAGVMRQVARARLVVEMLVDDATKAIEYRVL
jgi:hypothetical protein